MTRYLKTSVCFGIFAISMLSFFQGKAEGSKQLSPIVGPGDTSIVMLHTNGDSTGNFAEYSGSAVSSLNIRIKDFNTETVYIGLSREYDDFGNPDGFGGLGTYCFRIIAPNGDTVHGPFAINSGNANADSWLLATSGPDVLDPINGYDTGSEPYATFVPTMNGDYRIEFTDNTDCNVANPGNQVNLKYFDFTVVSGGVEQPGRLWSLNWAFVSPPINPNTPPECQFDRPFNGVLYSYTTDGFVSKIDFAGSGFQGLQFTVAFGDRGPGNTGNVLLDRMSVNNADATANAAVHMVFISEPDDMEFPSSTDICGEVALLAVQCVADTFCFNVGITRPGQIEIILDFTGDGMFTDDTTDVILAVILDVADTVCISWNGLKGDGSPLGIGEDLPAIIRYSQGVQHYAAYDVELLKFGFCVETVRPICPGVSTDLLYWDDTNIADDVNTPLYDESDPGTGQPAMEFNGCQCQTMGCRTWTNVHVDADTSCIGQITGYGDQNTLNTWWFASTTIVGPFDLPFVAGMIQGDSTICLGDSTEFTAMATPDTIDFVYQWTGPNGFMATTESTGLIADPGLYSVTVTDTVSTCSFEDQITLVVTAGPAITVSFTCVGDNGQNADVDVAVMGNGPFTFLWSNNSMNDSLFNVPPDTYIVTVTDTNGCQAIDSVTVEGCCELDVVCPPLAGGQFACLDDVPAPDTTVIIVNDYCGPLSISSIDVELSGEATGCILDTIVIQRTYTITDGGGGMETCIQIFRVVDDEDPEIFCPANITVNCDAGIDTMLTGSPIVSDNCTSVANLFVTYVDSGLPGNCIDDTPVIRTWTVTDECGNFASCTQTITVQDTVAPEVVPMSCPSDITIECDQDKFGIGAPSYTDNCTENQLIDLSSRSDSTGFDGSCVNDVIGVITITFFAEDLCGNIDSSCAVSVFVVDTVAPLFTAPGDVTADCNGDLSPATTGEVTDTTDNCTAITLSFVDEMRPADCPAQDSIFRTWTAMDACGNSSSDVQIIVTFDNAAPTFTVPADVTIDCEADTDPINTGEIIDTVDLCGSAITVGFSDEIAEGNCEGESVITRTWTVSDECLNSTSEVQLITLIDTTGPGFQVPADTVVDCPVNVLLDFGSPGLVSDNCSSVSSVTFVDEIVPGVCPATDTLYRTWIATDGCDNTSTQVQTITFIDTIPPGVEFCPDDATFDCATPTDTLGLPIYFDLCSEVTISFRDDSVGFMPPSSLGMILRKFFGTDACGNVDSTCIQTITIQDTLAPEVLTCPPDMTIECPNLADTSLTGVPTYSDNCFDIEDLTLTFSDDTVAVGGECTDQTITRTFYIADPEGNIDSSCVQIITIEDEIAPTFTPPPAATVNCDDDLDDLTILGNVTNVMDCNAIADTSYVDTTPTGCNETGLFVRTWTVTDVCGNSASATQNITIQDTPPNALCQDITIDFGMVDVYMLTPEEVDGGSFDDCGDVILSLSQTEFECEDFSGGSITIQLTVTDECGLTDVCDVQVSALGGGGLTIACPDDVTFFLGSGECEVIVNYVIEASSLCGGVSNDATIIQVDDSGLTSGDYFPIGVTIQEYIAYNESGDTVSCSFTITVIEGPEDPFLVCNDLLRISLDPNCQAIINPDIILEGGTFGCFDDFIICVEDFGCDNGEIIITNPELGCYTVTITNEAGNSCWGIVCFEDKLPPQITCSDDVTVNCGESTDPVFETNGTEPANVPYAPNAFDACGEVTLDYTDVETGELCENIIITRTWTATDESGHTASCTQTITIIPLTLEGLEFPPTYVGACGESSHPNNTGWPTLDGVEISGGFVCNIFLTWHDHPLADCGGGIKIIRTWTVLDWCTLEIEEGVQIIKLTDDQAPVLICPPDQTVGSNPWFCYGDAILAIPTAYDQCGTPFTLIPSVSAGILIHFSGNHYRVDELPLGTHTVTWTAEDACGNDTTCTYEITVIDDVPPVPACDEHTILTLTTDNGLNEGLTKLHATTLDDGSYDNCGPVTFMARRMASCIDFDWIGLPPQFGEYPNNDGGLPEALDQGLTFQEWVPFACCDVGKTIMVELRVTDQYGNFNSCMVEVEVQDKLPPLIICPPDITVSCEFWFNAHETNGFVPADGLEDVFGRVLDANEYDEHDREWIIIHDPGGIYPHPYHWGLDGWADDNCDVTVTVNTSIDDDCTGDLPGNEPDGAVRLVTRIFRAQDGQGNTRTCTQRIWVVDFDPFYITDTQCGLNNADDVRWPCDLILTDCPEGDLTPENLSSYAPNNRPIVNDDNCSIIGVSYKDQIFYFIDGACFKIVRTWTVIDWCQFEADGEGGHYGYWQYVQVIKVNDHTGAQFTDCPSGPITLCVDDEGITLPANNQVFLGESNPNSSACSVHVLMTRTVYEACSDEVIYDVKVYPFNGSEFVQVLEPTHAIVDSNNEAILVFNTGQNSLPSNHPIRRYGLPYNDRFCSNYPLPGGSKDYHRILWSVEDGCGNLSTCSYLFRLEDCKKPTPICVGLSSVVMPSSGSVTIWAADFDSGSSVDDCTAHENLLFSFSGDSYQPSKPFDCELIQENGSSTFILQIWVADEGNDQNCDGVISWAERNKDFCTTFIVIDDNEEVCPGGVGVAGEIETALSEPVELVAVRMKNANGQLMSTHVTDKNGRYQFSNALLSYTVEPSRNDNHKNGVSTLDLVEVQKHLLGIKPLTNPYKLIAADANNSESVSALDLVEIRSLILGQYVEFPRNTSWRFVDADFEFDNPVSPWPFAESIDLESGMTLHENFIGIKIGDINGSVTANAGQIQTRGARQVLTLHIEDRAVKAGEIVEIPVYGLNFHEILGFQLTMETPSLEFIGVESGTIEMMSDFIASHQYAITMSFGEVVPLTTSDEEALFILSFKATANGALSSMLSVSSKITEAEAYRTIADGTELLDIALTFDLGARPALEYALYQNEPNPFENQTVIGFNLPSPMYASLTVYDLQGREIRQIDGNYAQGYNEIVLKDKDLKVAGAYYYRLNAGDFTASKKLILSRE